jgi:hypothetical protein
MKMRYLQPNKGTTLPQEICFLGVSGTKQHIAGSVEHDIVHMDSFVCRFMRMEQGKHSRCTELYNTSPQVFWTYLDNRMSRLRPVTVFAYDVTSAVTLLGLWRLLDKGLYSHGAIIDSDPPVIVPIHNCCGRVCFVDVRNYFSMPLDDLAASFGVTIGEDFAQIDTNGDSYAFAKYREQVAEISTCALMRFVREHNLGRWKTTIALQALQSFRHRFAPRSRTVSFGERDGESLEPKVKERIFPLSHDDYEIKAFERKANYSGQDECFFVGTVIKSAGFWKGESDFPFERNGAWLYGPVYHVDCNSLYPYVMKHARYPSRYIGKQHFASVEHLGKLLGKYCVIARVLIETQEDTFPLRLQDRIIYPTGMYWTTLCGKELEYAWRSGAVKQVGFHVCYETMDLFSEYVDYFFTLKTKYVREKNQAMALISKLMLNTLQGKFSQRAKRWKESPDVRPIYRWGKWYVIEYETGHVRRYRSIAGQTQEQVIENEIDYSMPVIGAVVTANARNMMAGIRQLCGRDNVLYQGTDSLLLLEPGYRIMVDAGLIHDSELGAFRLKGVYENAVVRNIQDYELGGTRTTRGLPKGARIVSGSAYTFDVRQTLQGMLFEKPAEQIRYTTVHRVFSGAYKGGSVGKDGWVTPYNIKYAEDRGDAWEGEDVAKLQAENAAHYSTEQSKVD